MGPDPSGLSTVIAARPELEGRIVSRRLSDWEQGMRANLGLRAALEEERSARLTRFMRRCRPAGC